MKFFVSIALLVFLVAPCKGVCQEPSSTLLENNGVQGYWFPMTVGDRLLKDVTELKLLREKLTLIDTKLESKDNLIDLLRQDVAASEAIADKWRVAFEEQIEVTHSQKKYYESEIKALKKWYRSPVLWFSVGVLVTGALAVGLNYGLAETRN